MKPVLLTPRLLLREMALADLDFVATMLADPDVMRFYPKRCTRAESEEWIRKVLDSYARHGHGRWLVLDKATGAPVGQVGVLFQHVDGADEREIGYMIHRPFWRRGFATEAAVACRDYAFDALRAPRVISLIRPENAPSIGVATKIGMKPERRCSHANLEHIVYAATRTTPPAGPARSRA